MDKTSVSQVHHRYRLHIVPEKHQFLKRFWQHSCTTLTEQCAINQEQFELVRFGFCSIPISTLSPLTSPLDTVTFGSDDALWTSRVSAGTQNATEHAILRHFFSKFSRKRKTAIPSPRFGFQSPNPNYKSKILAMSIIIIIDL